LCEAHRVKTNELPFIDRHCIDVTAPPVRVWAALSDVLARGYGGLGFRWVARVLGSDETAVTGPPLVAGSTVVGFRVTEVQPERRVRLTGHHRFSRYALTFELDDGSLCATTEAEFPGVHGTLYKALVIGSHGHVVATRRILKDVRRRAEAVV
jgi:hypothetical protein